MAGATYKMTGIILRKTKLSESDLIITILDEDGSLRKGVAKGARKPTSPFSARLELYNKADLLCAAGKSLDIIKEARLVFGGKELRSDMDKSMAAASAAELALRCTQPSLENPRLYDMTEKLMRMMDACDEKHICALLGAYYLKCFSVCGIRPALTTCVSCGETLADGSEGTEAFSYEDGGYVCAVCSGSFETIRVPAATLLWAHALLYSTFDEISEMDAPSDAMFDILHLGQQWCRVHIGSTVRSLKMFMSLCSSA